MSLVMAGLIFYVFSMSGDNNSIPKSKRDPTDVSVVTSPSASQAVDTAMLNQERIEETMQVAEHEFKQAENDKLEQEEQAMKAASNTYINSIRIGLGKLLGSAFSNEEVETIAEQVEEQLNMNMTKTLRLRADSITQHQIQTMEQMTEEANDDEVDVASEIFQTEEEVVEEIGQDIDQEATRLTSTMKARAAAIEKAVLEERLSAKLGKRVKLVIEDDEVRSFEGDDGLFHGLNTLLAPTPSPKAKSASAATSPLSLASHSSWEPNGAAANRLSASKLRNPAIYGATTTATAAPSSV